MFLLNYIIKTVFTSQKTYCSSVLWIIDNVISSFHNIEFRFMYSVLHSIFFNTGNTDRVCLSFFKYFNYEGYVQWMCTALWNKTKYTWYVGSNMLLIEIRFIWFSWLKGVKGIQKGGERVGRVGIHPVGISANLVCISIAIFG